MNDLMILWSTFPDAETARRVAAMLVEERVAACVNVMPGVESVYRWQGKVETSSEVLAMIKTTRLRLVECETRLRVLHPYEVPEIVAVRADYVAESYARWVQENTTAA
jgi:periplasmic divalent cation tolerance protein